MKSRSVFSSLLAALAVFVLVGLPTNFASAGPQDQYSEGVIGTLRLPTLYAMPEDVDPENWVSQLISLLQHDLATSPQSANTTNLMIGDALHWLAHLQEERAAGDQRLLKEAYSNHYLSREFYKNTDIEFSPAIAFLTPMGHSGFHLSRVAVQIGVPVRASWLTGHRIRAMLPENIWNLLVQQYGDMVRSAVRRAKANGSLVQDFRFSRSLSCELIFGMEFEFSNRRTK